MYKISLITGDGIGPELSESVKTILDTIHDKLNVKFDVNSLVAGILHLKKLVMHYLMMFSNQSNPLMHA